MIKEQIQWQSQRLIFSQCTYYSFSTWISPENIFLSVVSLSIKKLSSALFLRFVSPIRPFLKNSSYFSNCFVNASFQTPNYNWNHNHFLYSLRLSLISNANCWYFVLLSFILVSMFLSCGHAMSQIQIVFFCLSSNVKSGRLDVVVFL